MRSLWYVAALLATIASADLCEEGSVDYEGNWYCQAVNAITYTGVGGSGSYNKVTNMDVDSGLCSTLPFGYSGSLAPLDEEVSLHFRGPIQLKQFAVYTPGRPSTKKARRDTHHRRHVRGHAHDHLHHPRKVEKRQVGATVTATIDGVVDTWINSYSGPPPASSTGATSWSAKSSAAASPPTLATSFEETSLAPESVFSQPSSTESLPPPSSATPAGGSIGFPAGGWGRQGYYDSAFNASDGLVFLNHMGSNGCSGTFDYTFGSSLSHATSDGLSCSTTAQTLEDTTLPSSAEVVIMTDQLCSSGDCGYVRPNTDDAAYHGFDGAQKAFFMEFQMPSDGQTTTDPYDPINQPAVWILNAQVPRTLQYGNSECSCWASGCGEFDIFEVLSSGYDKAKSTLHGNVAGGCSDYFDRPWNSPIKVAVVLYSDNIHIKILDSDIEFGSEMPVSTINDICSSTSDQSQKLGVSLFNLAGAGSG